MLYFWLQSGYTCLNAIQSTLAPGKIIPPLHFMIFRSIINSYFGSIAQPGWAFASHARGHGFDPRCFHCKSAENSTFFDRISTAGLKSSKSVDKFLGQICGFRLILFVIRYILTSKAVRMKKDLKRKDTFWWLHFSTIHKFMPDRSRSLRKV